MTHNLIQAAREQVAQLTQQAYERAVVDGGLPGGQTIIGTVEVPKDSKNGDFASSFAMAGAKALKMSPRAIAQAILDHLELTDSYFQRAEIAGPGFLNFFYAPRWYGAVLAAVESDPKGYGGSGEGRGEKVMVEFVSANPTGPMHMGNARGGVLGDTLANVLRRDGYDTWKEFYVNDAGNQIAKFAQSINARYMQLIVGEDAFPFPENGYQGDDIRELAQAIYDQHGDSWKDLPEQERLDALAQYPEEVHQAARTYDPSRINRYLTGLAGDFHRFYNACRCMVDDPCLQAARLKLADTTRQVLANGLGLLGVSAPEKM